MITTVLALIAILLAGALGISELYTPRTTQGDGFTTHGKARIGIITASTGLAIILLIVKSNQLSSESQKAEKFERKVAELSKDLVEARQWADNLKATNGDLQVSMNMLQRQVDQFRNSLKDASEAKIAGLPQRVSASTTNKWKDGAIVLKLETFMVESVSLVPIAVTPVFKGSGFKNGTQTIKIELVNVRPNDMLTHSFNLSNYSIFNAWKYAPVAPDFQHGDVFSFEASKSKSYAICMLSKYRSSIEELIRRNPDAGIRISVK